MDKLDKIEPDEITIKGLIKKLKSGIKYIKGKWPVLLIFSLLGGFISIIYSVFEKPVYKAVSTFVLEESGHGGGLGLGEYSNIASLAGIDIGSGSEKGLFQGDNILQLYRSRLMIEKTLLSKVEINGKKQLLIDRYIQSNNLKAEWGKKYSLRNINFNNNPKKFSRLQDSLLRDITKYINKNILNVTKPDKKLSIISVEVNFRDEYFAQFFNEELVQNVNDFYVQTKTKKEYQNVQILQHQADSVRNILNMSIGKVGAITDANPNPNPTLRSLVVPYQKRQIDVQANSAIYAEIVKNLELSKISLRQETPLIQLIDEPILPLEVDKVGFVKGVFTGIVAGFFIGIFYIIIARLWFFVKNIE